MGITWAICRRDLIQHFTTPLAWLVLAAWTLLTGGVFYFLSLSPVHAGGAAFEPLYVTSLQASALLLTLIAPALTMNTFAAEEGQGTMQLLLTVPARDLELVLGKFAAGAAMLLLLLAATLSQPLALALVSDTGGAQVVAGYLGLALASLFLAALGTWISLLVASPVAAYVLTFAAIALLHVIGILAASDAPTLAAFGAAVGLGPHLEGFVAGEPRLVDAVYFLALTGACLALAQATLGLRRSAGRASLGRLAGPLAGSLVIAGLLIAAADRADLRADWTADRRFSLDPLLLEQVDASTGPVALTGIWPTTADTDQPWAAAAGELVKERIERLAAARPTVTFRVIDSQDRPLRDAFAEAHGEASDRSLYVVIGDGRPFRIPLNQVTPQLLQRELAGALVSLAEDQRPLAVVFQGHGELTPGGGNGDGDVFFRRIEQAGFDVALLEERALASGTVPPADAVVVWPGPTLRLPRRTTAVALGHLDDGGSLLLLADHRLDPDLAVGLRQRGIVLGPAWVPELLAADPAAALTASATAPAQVVYSVPHSVGRDGSFHRLVLRGEQLPLGPWAVAEQARASGADILSPWSTPVLALPTTVTGGAGGGPATAEVLLRLEPGSAWTGPVSRRQEPPASEQPALALALAAEWQPRADSAGGERRPRLAVWGSRQAATNGLLGPGGTANDQLLADMLRWLAGRSAAVPIPRAEFRAYRVEADESTMWALMAVLVILIPFTFLGGGILMWWDRRKTE